MIFQGGAKRIQVFSMNEIIKNKEACKIFKEYFTEKVKESSW
jgi:hypothetical protein